MTKDFFVIDIPIFVPIYESDKKYGWSKYKDNLWELLKDTTDGYCMYCYDSIWVNEQRRGQIEHAIEKSNSEKSLSDCVPNLGIACENCNDSYKRRGELKRKLPVSIIHEFEMVDCKKYNCKKPCNELLKLRSEYMKQGKIIVQPFEAKIQDTGHCLGLQYDLLKCKYVPSNLYGEYTSEELEIINSHIEQFGLNSPERKNFEVGKYCKNVIDFQSLMPGVTYNNLVVNLFRKKLECLDIKLAVKICEVVYNNAFLRLAT